MNKLSQILLGTDFSAGSRAAALQARRLADWKGAALHVLHVIDILSVRAQAEAFQLSLMLLEPKVLKRRTADLTQWLANSGIEANGSAEVVIGMPLDELLARAVARDANLLVLGVRGDSSAQPDTGELALQCLRKAPCKVMLVHPRNEGAFKVVVAGIDFSETSREAARQARHVADLDGSKLHFVHVSPPPKKNFFTPAEHRNSASPFAINFRSALERRLRNFVGDLAGPDSSFGLVEHESSDLGIAEYATAHGADLLVIGSKGHSELSYLLLGSTVEKMLRRIPCSVLVIRPAAPAA